MAYCTALEVDQAWLVYANGTAGATTPRIRNSSITVTEYPLNLDVIPQELVAQIEHLARSAWT